MWAQAALLCWIGLWVAHASAGATWPGLQGVHHLQFAGRVHRSHATLHVFIKCHINRTSASSGDVHLKGFTLPVQDANATYERPYKMRIPKHLLNWKPTVKISYSYNIAKQGYAPPEQHITMTVVKGKGAPSWFRHEDGRHYIPYALTARISNLNITRPVAMRIMVDDWPGFNLFSTGYCTQHERPAVAPSPKVVVATKPNYGYDMDRLLDAICIRLAYLTCLGVHHVAQYATPDQVPHMLQDARVQRFVSRGLLSVISWPMLAYPGTGAAPGNTDRQGVNGVAWLSWVHSHSLLSFWDLHQPVYVIGQDFDEVLASHRPGGIYWPSFFARHNASVLRLSIAACTQAKHVLELSKCNTVPHPHMPIGWKQKSFLDTRRIQRTICSHTGTGTDPSYEQISASELFFIHLNHTYPGTANTSMTTHLSSILDSACFKQYDLTIV